MVSVYVVAVSILAKPGTSAVVGRCLVRWVCVCGACSHRRRFSLLLCVRSFLLV